MFKQLIFTLSLVLTLTAVFGQKSSKLKGNVQFEIGKSLILPTEETKLTGILAQLRSSPLEYEIAIQGNTDATGSKKYNYNLSKERVEAVKNWFIKHGIVEDVLSDDFFGEENPVAENTSEQGKQLNRRVDIDITFFNDGEIPYTPPKPQVEPLVPIVEKLDVSLNRFFTESLESVEQPIFKASTTETIVITGAKGSQFVFPPDLFGVPEGTPIQLTIKEAFKMSDIFMQNLSTTMTNKDSVLVTTGMVFIEARTADGTLIYPKKNYTIKIPQQANENIPLIDTWRNPKAEANPVQMFVGTRTQSNQMQWSLPPTFVPAVYKKSPILAQKIAKVKQELAYYSDTTGCSQMFVWRRDSVYFVKDASGEDVKMKKILYKVSDSKPQFYRFESINTAVKMSPFCQYLADNLVKNDLTYGRRNWKRKHLILERQLDFWHNAYTYYMVRRPPAVIKKSFLGLKKKRIILPFDYYEALVKNMKNSLAYWQTQFEKEAAIEKEAEKDARSQANMFIFETRQMGYINCDYFLRNNTGQPLVNVPTNVKGDTKTAIKIIFKTAKVVLDANYRDSKGFMSFSGIPQGENAFVVGLRMEEGKSYLALEAVNTATANFNLTFEELSADKIKEKLKILD